MRFTLEIEGLDAARSSIDPKIVKKAIRFAVGETAKVAKTETSTQIRKFWMLKRGDLDRKLTSKRMKGGQEAELSISGPPISLSYFGAVQIMGTRKLTRGKDGKIKSVRASSKLGPQPIGVRVRISADTPALLRRAWLTNTRNFAGRAKGGALLFGENTSARVLERFGGKVVGPKSISIASMFQQVRVSEPVIKRASDYLQLRFAHHIDRFLEG